MRTISDIIATLQDGNRLDKAKNYDEDVDFLIKQLHRVEDYSREIHNGDVKARIERLEKLERALAAAGYTRGIFATG